MKVTIMQPYLFPYIGYFQMIYESDEFVFYDNVDYISRGFINRNQILDCNKTKQYFTVPVKKTKLGTKINDVYIDGFKKWNQLFLKQLKFAYSKAPYFKPTYSLLEDFVLNNEYFKISDLASDSVIMISNYLNINFNYSFSSEINGINELNNKEEKLEYILKRKKSDIIVLPPGAMQLYKDWKPKGIEKKILDLPRLEYNQFRKEFIKNLSIIDVLMFNSKMEVSSFIENTTFQ